MEFSKKATYVRAIIYITFIYAGYDALLRLADSRKLIMIYSRISGGILPMVVLYDDIFLVAACLVIAFLFDKHAFVESLAVTNTWQLMLMALGAVIFIAAALKARPGNIIDVYKIVHILVTLALLEEVVFRGVLYPWLRNIMPNSAACLIAGGAGGVLSGINSVVVNDVSVTLTMLPLIIWGMLYGGMAAWVYGKTRSLWLVIYIHAAILLL